MSVATAPHGPANSFPSSNSVPPRHREWITLYADERAAQAYLTVAGDPDPNVWMSAGRAVLHDVATTLALLDEDLGAIRAAQFFAADRFVRRFVYLGTLGGRGGRA